jgi:transcriptional regulator with XRE-family HTH domain
VTPAELTQQREACRLSQRDLGRLVGRGGDWVRDREQGKVPISPEDAYRLARALVRVGAQLIERQRPLRELIQAARTGRHDDARQSAGS